MDSCNFLTLINTERKDSSCELSVANRWKLLVHQWLGFKRITLAGVSSSSHISHVSAHHEGFHLTPNRLKGRAMSI